MCKIISVVSCKGGVGKTTSAVNISSYMQMQGKKVCAVDLDPQHNLSKHFGIHPGHLVDRPTIYNLLNAAIEDTEDDEMDKLVKESIIHSTTVDVNSVNCEAIVSGNGNPHRYLPGTPAGVCSFFYKGRLRLYFSGLPPRSGYVF